MNASDFTSDLLASLATLTQVTKVELHTEGPIVSGRAFIGSETFLAFYYNQITTTQAFALVKDADRVWGIDFDRLRGWHLHPVKNSQNHIPIEPQNISSIIEQLKNVVDR